MTEARHQRFYETVALKEGQVISPYKNYSTKVEIQCKKLHTWHVTPNHVVNGGSWCPKCPKGISLKSKDNFFKVVAEKGGVVISDYYNNNTKVRIRCGENHEWNVTPHSVAGVMNSWCPFCSNNSPEQAAINFYNKIAEKGGIPLEIYRGAYARVLIQCHNRHTWKCVPHDIMSCNSWCAKCSGNCPEQARDKFYETVTSNQGEVLEPYINSSSRVRVRCINRHEWNCVPGNVIYGDWCRACNDTCPKEAYKRLCSIVADNKGEILENYVNSQTKISFKCKRGHIWKTCPTNITNSGCWCPQCNESHGERAVRSILERYNIPFTTQKELPSLPGYYFDFYFHFQNKEFYIEYDGEQHFRHVKFFSKTQEIYQYRRSIDVQKSQAVITANSYLIRLDYTLSADELEKHILTAINSPQKLYLSDQNMYQWIIDGVNLQPSQPLVGHRPLTLNITYPNTSQPSVLTLNITRPLSTQSNTVGGDVMNINIL
jgi:hypothetical protein